MYTIGNVSPEYPMHRIIDAVPRPDRGALSITLNGKYDGVHDTYDAPLTPRTV